jgi:ubiquitin-conjugating enzyme E2 D
LTNESDSNFSVCLKDESDVLIWQVSIIAPRDSPFSGRLIELNIFFPIDYPYRPPIFKLIKKNKLFNVDNDGVIQLEILQDKWIPTNSILSVLY